MGNTAIALITATELGFICLSVSLDSDETNAVGRKRSSMAVFREGRLSLGLSAMFSTWDDVPDNVYIYSLRKSIKTIITPKSYFENSDYFEKSATIYW